LTSKIAILGYGRSGRAAEALAKRLGYKTCVYDDAQKSAADEAMLEGCSFAVVSPGLAMSHPMVKACEARHLALVSELQFGVEELARQGVRMIAVTGSKGKSSVVKVVADGLNRAGNVRAVACGNFGKPVSEVAVEGGVEWAVVEVSSFQMETTNLPANTFEAAAILNLQADHLDRHGTLAAYHALKRKLLTMAKARIEGPVGLERFDDLVAGSYFGNEILQPNGTIAAALMRLAGLEREEIAAAFRDYVALPHRMNEVGVFRGVRCVDDSKATSIAALEAGVTMCGGGVRLIAGGLAKCDDPATACECLKKYVKKIYLIGRSAEAFAAAWKGAVECELCGTMDKAVASAFRDAGKGETILLSPGTASFDQFKNFEQRGDVFVELVNKEGQTKI
jgi:UDP-N-acetylmuramoylalanine--D-glutamate ligase